MSKKQQQPRIEEKDSKKNQGKKHEDKKCKNQNESKALIDDFFTQFIDKRQKHYLKKKEKIQELAKKKESELTPEQVDMVQNQAKNEEKIMYFDEIKDLYFQAHSKKESSSPQPNGTNATTDLRTQSCLDFLNLFYTGQILKNLTKHPLKSVEESLSSTHQMAIFDIHAKVFSIAKHSHKTFESSKETLTSYLQNTELIESIEKFINLELESNDCHEKAKAELKIQEVVAHQAPQVVPKQEVEAKKPDQKTNERAKLFDRESDDEDEDHVDDHHDGKSVKSHSHKNGHKSHHDNKAHKKAEAGSESKNDFKIAPLPEDNNVNDDWVQIGGNKKNFGNRQREKGYRNNGEQRRGRGEHQEGDFRPHREERQERGRGERRNYNDKSHKESPEENPNANQNGHQATDGQKDHKESHHRRNFDENNDNFRGRGRGRGYRGRENNRGFHGNPNAERGSRGRPNQDGNHAPRPQSHKPENA